MDLSQGVVVDTSIWLNLLATGRIWDIVASFGARFTTPTQVIAEVQRDPISKANYPVDQHPLLNRAEVEVVALEGASLDLFVGLVNADAGQRLGVRRHGKLTR